MSSCDLPVSLHYMESAAGQGAPAPGVLIRCSNNLLPKLQGRREFSRSKGSKRPLRTGEFFCFVLFSRISVHVRFFFSVETDMFCSSNPVYKLQSE